MHHEAVGRHVHAHVCVVDTAPVPALGRSCGIITGAKPQQLVKPTSGQIVLSVASASNEDGTCPRVLCERSMGATTFETNDFLLLANRPACAGRTVHSIDTPLTTPHTLQRATADFCALHRLSPLACGHLAAHLSATVHRDLLAASLGLPAVQHQPSPQQPFVFLHIEKTAGTALRRYEMSQCSISAK